MSTLRLVREDQTQLRFAHAPLVGVAFVVVGAAMAYFGLFRFEEDGVGRWIMGAMGILFVIAGVLIVLWRHDLTLDLLSRTYRGQRGFWPSPRPLRGTFDELRSVVLERVWRGSSRSSREHAFWTVSLDFGDWDVQVLETRDESAAMGRHEHFARLLRVPAVDRTGEEETRRAWNELDRSVAEDLRSKSEEIEAPGPPPEGSRIVWEPAAGMASILLPQAGFSRGTASLLLFGLIFAGFGTLPLLALSGIWDVPVSGSRVVGWVVGVLFCLVGLAIMLAAIWGSYAREMVHEEHGGLRFHMTFLGQRHRRRFVPKPQIEEIALRDATTSRRRRRKRARGARSDGRGNESTEERQEVVVRSDTQLVRIGSDLTSEEQRWLHRALHYLAAR